MKLLYYVINYSRISLKDFCCLEKTYSLKFQWSKMPFGELNFQMKFNVIYVLSMK